MKSKKYRKSNGFSDDKKSKRFLTCPVCEKGTLSERKVPYEVYGEKLGIFPARVCSQCNEEWFDESTARKIESLEKEKGFFGLSTQTKISYSGNSLIIRIPKAIAEFMRLKREEIVTIHPEGRNKLSVEL